MRIAFLVALFAVSPVYAICVPPAPLPVVCQVGKPCPPPAPAPSWQRYGAEDLAAYDRALVAASTRPPQGSVTPAHASSYAIALVQLRRVYFYDPNAPTTGGGPVRDASEKVLYEALTESMVESSVAGATWTWFQPASFAQKAHGLALQAMDLRKVAFGGC